MGQNNSMDDQHLDGNGQNNGSNYQQGLPVSAAAAESQRQLLQQQQLQQQQQQQQQHDTFKDPVGNPPRREDSGNDFAMAMNIADSSGGGVGNSNMNANAQGNDQPYGSPIAPHGSVAAQKVETVPTAFKWVHGGHEVYVTGSFNNWQGKILMYENDDGEFTLLIDIPPGTHHYKYIVDQEWRLDEDAPTVQIANVWNNVVEVKRPVFEYTPANFADSDDDEDERKQKAAYGQRAPLSNDYVNDPPKLPPHLTEILLNQTQPQDPMMLPVPLHVVINHLYVMHSDPNILVTGLTQRFKPNSHTKITHKFVTTVYYAPRNMLLHPGLINESPPPMNAFHAHSQTPQPTPMYQPAQQPGQGGQQQQPQFGTPQNAPLLQNYMQPHQQQQGSPPAPFNLAHTNPQ